MICSSRIYKGEDVEISIPFAVSGYSDLVVSYFTDGDVHIERTEEQLVVEDGYITANFEDTDLDLLEDGVVRYTITCEVDGADYVISSNTPYYLKTPKDYDAKTAEEVYEDGYLSGSTDGFNSGYTSGHTDGYAEGEVVGKAEGYVSGYTAGEAIGIEEGEAAQKAKLVATAVTENGTYNREDGWNEVSVDVNPELLNKSEQMTAKTQTFVPDMPRPNDVGNTIYGGLLSTFEALIDQYTNIRVKTWDDAQHSDWTLEGVFRKEGDEYGYESADFIPLTACTTQWTDLGKVKVYFDGHNVFFYAWSPYGVYYTDEWGQHTFTDDELIFPTKSYYGMSAITVTAGVDENIAYADMGIGFSGPATIRFYDHDTDYKMGRYIIDIYSPEDGGWYWEPDIDERDHGSITFTGSGYHVVWFGIRSELPEYPDWINISSSVTDIDLINNDNFDIPNGFNPLHSDQTRHEIDIYGSDGYSQLVRYLMNL